MFMLRAAFWLTIGFLLVAPHGTDLGAAVSGAKDQAIAAGMQAGEQFVTSQLLTPGTAHNLVSSLSSSILTSTSPAAVPMHNPLPAGFVFPQPRPAAFG